jgi:hypothetical protein
LEAAWQRAQQDFAWQLPLTRVSVALQRFVTSDTLFVTISNSEIADKPVVTQLLCLAAEVLRHDEEEKCAAGAGQAATPLFFETMRAFRLFCTSFSRL